MAVAEGSEAKMARNEPSDAVMACAPRGSTSEPFGTCLALAQWSRLGVRRRLGRVDLSFVGSVGVLPTKL